MNDRVLTPRKSKDTAERFRLNLDEESWQRYEESTAGAVVFDQDTKLEYLVVRDSCGLPHCNCDAYVAEFYTPVEPPSV